MIDIWSTNNGIYLGFARNLENGADTNTPLTHPIRYVGDRHIVTVGPNGSGKSTRALLPNIVELTDWSIVIIDPKGELAAATTAHRAKHTKIIRLNPFDVLALGSDGFNPLMALDPADANFSDDAMGLAEALIRIEGKEPHFPESAQELVCALIMYVRLVFPKPSLVLVRELLALSSAAFQKLVVARDFDHRGLTVPGMVRAGIVFDCHALETKAKRFTDVGPENREMMSVFSTANTQTRWLDSPQIHSDLAKTAIDFSILKREPTTIYLILPTKRLGTHSNWLRLMLTSILQPLMSDTGKSEVPVLFMLDEFAQLGHLPIIERTMALMRGYGLKLWTVVQDLSQISTIYGQRWESFLGNAGVLQSFAPQDVFTSKYLSDLTGLTTYTPSSATDVGPGAKLNMGQIQRPLMLPEEIRRMGDGMSLIFSNKLKGTVAISYFPRPDALAHVKAMFEKFFANMVNPNRPAP